MKESVRLNITYICATIGLLSLIIGIVLLVESDRFNYRYEEKQLIVSKVALLTSKAVYLRDDTGIIVSFDLNNISGKSLFDLSEMDTNNLACLIKYKVKYYKILNYEIKKFGLEVVSCYKKGKNEKRGS